MKIAFIDSGAGGLSLLNEVIAASSAKHEYVYFADVQNMPYGDKSESFLKMRTAEICGQLTAHGAEIIVLACNTATAAAADYLRACGFSVVGVEPAIKPAARECQKILVLATERTAGSKRMRRLCDSFSGGRADVVGCRRLASVIEDNFHSDEAILKCLSEECPKGYDGVVLGCTHYSLRSKLFESYYGKAVRVLDGNQGAARHTLSAAGDLGGGGGGIESLTLTVCGEDAKKYRQYMDILLSLMSGI